MSELTKMANIALGEVTAHQPNALGVISQVPVLEAMLRALGEEADNEIAGLRAELATAKARIAQLEAVREAAERLFSESKESLLPSIPTVNRLHDALKAAGGDVQ